MRHLATWRRAPVIPALLLLLPLAAGPCHRAGPVKTPLGRVVPEDEDEQRSTKPHGLGGPGHGTESTKGKVRATPALDDFIENLTDSALVAYLSQLQYDMGDRSQRVRAACVHNPTGHPHPIPAPKPCNIGDGAELAIEPEVGVHLWDFSAIPEHGIIVARIINYDNGDREEVTYGFPPGQRVWWVVDRPNGVMRSRFFVRTYNTLPAVRQIRDVAANYPLVNCHPEQTHQYAQASFAKCSDAPHLKTTSASRDAAHLAALPVASLRTPGSGSFAASAPSSVPLPDLVQMVVDGTWVTCRGGCCATSP